MCVAFVLMVRTGWNVPTAATEGVISHKSGRKEHNLHVYQQELVGLFSGGDDFTVGTNQ